MNLKRTATTIMAVASLALLTGLVGACHSSSKTPASVTSTGNLPAASDLMSQAETAMGNVQTVHFTLKIDGTIPNLPVQSADGVLTHAGDAMGTATIAELGTTIEAKFIITGGAFYLNALTGGYQKLPLASATQVYDPSAILDPNRGIPKVLSTATNTKTVGSTTMDGGTAYQVSFTADPTTIGSLIPGASGNITGSIWIDKATGHVDQAVFTVPTSGKAATVTITLDNYDAPVTINAP